MYSDSVTQEVDQTSWIAHLSDTPSAQTLHRLPPLVLGLCSVAISVKCLRRCFAAHFTASNSVDRMEVTMPSYLPEARVVGLV